MCGYVCHVPCTTLLFSSESHETRTKCQARANPCSYNLSSFPFFPILSFDASLSFMHSLGLVIQKSKKEEIGAHTMVIAFIHHSWCSLCCDSNIYAYCTHSNKSIQIFHSIELYDAKNNSHNTTKYNTARAYHGNNINTQPRQRQRQLGALMLLNDSSMPITTLEISCHKRIERWHDKRNKNI